MSNYTFLEIHNDLLRIVKSEYFRDKLHFRILRLANFKMIHHWSTLAVIKISKNGLKWIHFAKSKYFQKRKLNRNLRRISF